MNLQNFGRVFGYTSAVPSALPISDRETDPRNSPRYSIPEAAAFLSVPERTMRYWFRGDHGFLSPSHENGKSIYLSFFDVTEAYVIETLRNHWDFKQKKLRKVIDYLRTNTRFRRPLLHNLAVIPEFHNLVLPARSKGSVIHLDIAADENLVFDGFVRTMAVRIKRDAKGKPVRLYPGSESDVGNTPVSMDPDVMSGELVVTGTRIPAARIMANYLGGKSAEKIADSYRLDRDLVQRVIQHFERKTT